MSKTPDTKPAASDPLLILVAALLLLGVAATIYFSANGPAKEFTKEPATHLRPIIQDEPRVVVVTKAGAPGAVAGTAAHGAEAKPEEKAAEAKPATPEKAAAPVAAVAAAPVVKPTADGKVHGKVVLRGTPPPEKPILAAKSDVNCGKAHPDAAPTTRNYMVGADGGLRNAVIRVVNAPAGVTVPAEKPLIDQTGCMYEPYVSAVLAGQPFTLRNSDGFLHNVMSSPKQKENKQFNISQVSLGQVNDKTFDKPEPAVKLACSVHPWMSGYIYVMENPFFAVTNEKGEFTLPDGLPAGKYTLEVSHMKAGIVTMEIEVGAGKGAEVTAELAVK